MGKRHSNHFQKFLALVILGTILYHCSSGSTRETYDTLEQHETRKKEIKALVAIRSAENLQKLLVYLRSDNKNSRIMAAHSLHFFARYLDQAFPDMERALSDPEWQVRTGAVAAVYYMGEKGQPLLPLVRKLVADPHENVSANAFSALSAITGGKEGGCGVHEYPQDTALNMTVPEIPANTALIFGNVGCAYTNDAIKLVQKMKLNYKLHDLYLNVENNNLMRAYLRQLKIRKYRTIPIVIYKGKVFEKPQNDGDIR
ncbi:MAG: hypothetical protein KF713_09485 [Turneriella sp.]|nr:hypothetical protein [Turneriella sp.]